MEILSRGGGIDHPEVAAGGELEEALEASAGMLRALALVAVGEEKRQRRVLSPLGAGSGNELVDHDLGDIDKVTILRFPEHEGVRRMHAVAILEAQDGSLGQRAVVDGK